jgi:Protein of unknown function (DUF998)
MTQANPGSAGLAALPNASDGATRRLLICGVLAGPFFVAVADVQVATRDGFDLARHPLSLLSLGDFGWIQIGNFVVSGLLSIAFAVGMRRALHPGRAGTWGPLLVGVFGLGLVIGGIFVTDPEGGFPSGMQEPVQRNWHATVHNIGPGVSFDALLVACFVLTRRFMALRQRTWAAYSAATGVALLLITWWPDPDSISVRLAVAIVVAFVWVTALARHLIRELTDRRP